ncbi:hypothetical protein [Nocardia sp. NBC_00416]|uniref:hypothetical protein n=1 Tax=Nocardia sp. NBC_00416 TaxID=2975991 RepID=UPI002E23DE6E
MKKFQVARVSLCAAAVAVIAASTTSAAAADDPFLIVSGTVHCVDNTYTLTVPAKKIQSGTSSYYFLDGASPTEATRIGSEQPLQPGQDATADWTPTTSGTHRLWMRGNQSGGAAIVIGPQAVEVVDTAPAGADCAADSTGGAGNGSPIGSISAG